jgi:hypothetical protein
MKAVMAAAFITITVQPIKAVTIYYRCMDFACLTTLDD